LNKQVVYKYSQFVFFATLLLSKFQYFDLKNTPQTFAVRIFV